MPFPGGRQSFLERLEALKVDTRVQPYTPRSSLRGRAQRLLATPVRSTGIDILDRSLDGGLPAGSVVYLSVDPHSMAEAFLYQFSSIRKTYYFTTSRRPAHVARNITDMNFDTENITFVDVFSHYYLDAYGEPAENIGDVQRDREVLDFTERQLKQIRDGHKDSDGELNIIFDNFSFYLHLGAPPARLLRLANLAYEISKQTKALTYLFALRGAHPEAVENGVMNVSDAIFHVESERVGDKVAHKMSIPKIRGRPSSMVVLRFKVQDGIRIDTSRDIA
ncbi:MAG: RAD55 family ATPase [Halobacteria archaeon]